MFSIASAVEPDWSEDAQVPYGGRANIHQWPAGVFESYQIAGKLHAQEYPVSITGALPPLKPIQNFLDTHQENPLKEILRRVGILVSGFKSFDDILKNLGLHNYPSETDNGVYSVPYPNGVRPNHRMGVGLIERQFGHQTATGFTFSCATCHSSNLFGKTVLGMTNRFPRANDFFVQAKELTPYMNSWLFKNSTGASDAETQLMTSTLDNLKRVAVKHPIALGLDTSLAQVALSLNLRADDEWATPSLLFQNSPRKDPFLDENPADSKPAVWWNLKYKNRWLSDGSVISGNPIITNILWNEIGRGTDLRLLNQWISENIKTIEEITTAAFSMEAPRMTAFFSEDKIDIAAAKRGEISFKALCSRCHGDYDKVWSTPGAESLSTAEQTKTSLVRYKDSTPVVDVGTDPYRRLGMKSLEQLNKLEISKRYNVHIEAQEGYVAPPLVGIWARWPYMHNNSIPNLCAVLTVSKLRPTSYFAGAANNPNTDFDYACNGYPLGSATPSSWKKDVLLYDTSKKGMSNVGHDEKIFIKNGIEVLSRQNKKDLIIFLQTL